MKKTIDIVNEVLEQCVIAYPVSSFIIGLYQQYQKHGSLSRKQLVGLYGKASEIKDIAPGKLASLEALINRMPVRQRSSKPEPSPVYDKDQKALNTITDILNHFPEHKGALFLKSLLEKCVPLTPAQQSDLQRFAKILDKKQGDAFK